MADWRGIHVPPLISPFTTDGALDENTLGELGRSVLDAGAAGLVALGTTAEAPALDSAERHAVIDVCADVCRGRGAAPPSAPDLRRGPSRSRDRGRPHLIVGVGSNDTATTRAALAELTRWPRIDAAMVTLPYFVRPSEAGVLAHVTELARTSPVPLILYHVPYRTALPLSPDCLRALVQLDGVVGMKYAPGAVDAATVDLFGDLPDDVAMLAGDDVLTVPLLGLGACGAILASAHLATEEFVRLVDDHDTDPARARRLGHALARWSAAAFAEPNPAVIKGVLHALGRVASPEVRLPLLAARSSSVQRALRCLDHVAAVEAVALSGR